MKLRLNKSKSRKLNGSVIATTLGYITVMIIISVLFIICFKIFLVIGYAFSLSPLAMLIFALFLFFSKHTNYKSMISDVFERKQEDKGLQLRKNQLRQWNVINWCFYISKVLAYVAFFMLLIGGIMLYVFETITVTKVALIILIIAFLLNSYTALAECFYENIKLFLPFEQEEYNEKIEILVKY